MYRLTESSVGALPPAAKPSPLFSEPPASAKAVGEEKLEPMFLVVLRAWACLSYMYCLIILYNLNV